MADFLKGLFGPAGLFLLVWVLIGIFTNTAAPHIPQDYSTAAAAAHSWIQYLISVMSWPLSHWHPQFTTGQWTPGGSA
jgi:uncharacterized membrane protein YfcA